MTGGPRSTAHTGTGRGYRASTTAWRRTGLLLWGLLFGAATGVCQELAPRPLPSDYKRVHQRALEKIEAGKPDKAIADLLAFREDHPEDAETQYLLCLAYCALEDLEAARRHMTSALDSAVFAGRFVGVLADRFTPLHDDPQYRMLQERFDHEPVNGPMLGRLTADSVSVWLRTRTAAEVVVLYGTHEDLSGSQVARATTSAEHGLTAILPLTDLKPGETYYYAILIGEDTRSFLPTHRFRMAEAAEGRLRVAFGGGAGFVPPHEKIWDRVAEVEADLLLLLGDNVYIDHPKSALMQEYCYDRRHGRPEFRRLVASLPVASIWDDHDFGTNDCHGGPETDRPAWKQDVWQRYRRWWVNAPRVGEDQAPGCYHDFVFGDVHFLMLDGRYYRTDPKADGPGSMLGPVQKQWLFERLAASDRPFHLLASPVPWTFDAKGDSPDTWNGYQLERDEILDHLDRHAITGVVLLSADRHRSDRWLIPRPGGRQPFHEFNSSRLTNFHTHAKADQAEFSYNEQPSFGVVDLDTTAAEASATYRIFNIEGLEVHEFTVPRSELDRSP